MYEAVKKEITETFNELDNILFSFSNAQLNTIPFEGSWTAGQVADHIIRSLSGLEKIINGPVGPANRAADEKVAAIRDLFLNFGIKMKSPDFIMPGAGPYEKENQLTIIGQLKEKMLAAVGQDLDLLCIAAEFPTFGLLTRKEWLNFYLVHTERHTQQVKNIFKAIK